MATYLELRGLFSDADLSNKLDIALIVSANDLLSGAPTAAQQKWAAHVFNSPRGESQKALMAVLAKNKALTSAQIQGATDSAIQAQVDSVVDTLVIAFTG